MVSLIRNTPCSNSPNTSCLKRVLLSTSSSHASKHVSGKRRRLQSKSSDDIVWITSTAATKEISDNEMSPVECLKSILEVNGLVYSKRASLSMTNFFFEPNEESYSSYTGDAIQAVRARDTKSLQEVLDSGKSLQSCNSFGESLIHMACRRGFTEVVSFLMKEGSVSIRVRDDYGRTPMHDACWTCDPNSELMDVLISEDASLLLLSDKRGHTPLDYVRREHWSYWNDYLMSRQEIIADKIDCDLFSEKSQ